MRIYKTLVLCNTWCEYNTILYCFNMVYTPSENSTQISIHNFNSGLHQHFTQLAGILNPTYKQCKL